MISSNIHLHKITRKTADALALQPLLADADDEFLFHHNSFATPIFISVKSKKQPQASVEILVFANCQHFAVSISHF